MDKTAIFTEQLITPTSAFPVDAVIRCEIARRSQRDDGEAVVEIATVEVDSIERQHRFEVKADQVFD